MNSQPDRRENSENRRPAVLSASTLAPLGAFLMVSIGGYQVYSSLQSAIRDGVQQNRDDIRDVKEDVRALRSEINNKTDDRWTKSAMRLWITRYQAENPGSKVPPLD